MSLPKWVVLNIGFSCPIWGGGGGDGLYVLFTWGKGVGSGHKGGRYPGCKGTILQRNQMGSWRWPCALHSTTSWVLI